MHTRILAQCAVATFAFVALLASRSYADEAKARITVSATVVRPCIVTSVPDRSAGSGLSVDCGERVERLGRKDSERTRFRLCDAESRESWCVGVRERFPGYSVRLVRFD